MPRSELLVVAWILAVAMVTACKTDPDAVCEHIGNCEQGGSEDWIAGCQSEADLAKQEATAAGCGGAFDDSFDCANSNFECHGATAVFPGCEGKKAALDNCLTSAVAKTACGALASKTSTCSPRDGGVSAAACTAARDCQARCFLDVVGDVCAPTAAELESFSRCVARCPTR